MKKTSALILTIVGLFFLGVSSVSAQETSSANTSSINSEYIIGPENALQIDVYYGKNEKISQKVRVSSGGSINFPLVGEVKVIVLSVAELQDKLTKLLGADYLVNPQVTVFIEEYSTVSIMGEVKLPGSYPIKGRLTVLELISLAEGFTDIAAPNNIKVIHPKSDGTKEERVVQIYPDMNKTSGDQANLVLSAGDVVIVPDSTVSITGEVKRPGVYPLKGKLTVLELISLAEGFTDIAALNNIKVIHTKPDGTKEERIVQAYNDTNKAGSDPANLILNTGDMVIVPDSTVSIMGEVKKPGVYPIKRELTVLQLISLAEGFTDIAAPNNVKVVHTKPDGTKEERIVQAYNDMNGVSGDQGNVVLSTGDMVIVPDSMVSITGEVKRPGVYPIKRELKVLQLISLAEGFTDIAAPNNVKVIHTKPDGTKEERVVHAYSDMNGTNGDQDKVALSIGDMVIVPDSMVSITGEVSKPGRYPMKGSLTVLELISLAGGFTKIAAPNRIKVIHIKSDGTKEEKVVRAYDYVNIKDGEKNEVILSAGDEVIVPESLF